MERTLLEWKGEEKVSLGERIGEVLWDGMGFFFFAGYMNNCWHLDSHMFWGYPHGTVFFFHPPPAAVTVGKQYATPHLPSSIDVCFCERCTAICLTKPSAAPLWNKRQLWWWGLLANFTVHIARRTWNGGWRPIQITHVASACLWDRGAAIWYAWVVKLKPSLSRHEA